MLKRSTIGNLSTITMNIDGVSYRIPLDIWAETSIIHKRVFDSMKNNHVLED